MSDLEKKRAQTLEAWEKEDKEGSQEGFIK
jgi:hypothetical protein